jgi:hypothetical protein
VLAVLWPAFSIAAYFHSGDEGWLDAQARWSARALRIKTAIGSAPDT